MKSTVIIAEYNPCHLGHVYHINKTKNATKSDCIIVIMSGDFTQRGVPAIADKYTRTAHALLCGADLVIELPSIYATASAEFFATGAVSTLSLLPDVEYLSFGCENDNPDILQKIASILGDEPDDFSALLKEQLKSGNSFAKARANALTEYCRDESVSQIVSSPNNILAIEYLKALRKKKLNLKPFCVKRQGNDYHSFTTDNPLTSATAVRDCLLKEDFDTVHTLLNEEVYNNIQENFNKKLPIIPNDCSPFVNYALNLNINRLEVFFDVNSFLANKIKSLYEKGLPYDFDALCMALKSKDLNHSRISRALCHILLNIKSDDMNEFAKKDFPSYLHVLGFNSTGRDYLNSIKKADLPIVTNSKSAASSLNKDQYKVFLKDVDAANIYNNIVMAKYKTALPDDYRSRPIIY